VVGDAGPGDDVWICDSRVAVSGVGVAVDGGRGGRSPGRGVGKSWGGWRRSVAGRHV